jgi:hypothetical protein
MSVEPVTVSPKYWVPPLFTEDTLKWYPEVTLISGFRVAGVVAFAVSVSM